MTDDTHPDLLSAIASLPADTKNLLQKIGFEDARKIIWATFSDDDCNTRIVYRCYRVNAVKVFSLLTATDLYEGLASARRHGEPKSLWGLADAVSL